MLRASNAGINHHREVEGPGNMHVSRHLRIVRDDNILSLESRRMSLDGTNTALDQCRRARRNDDADAIHLSISAVVEDASHMLPGVRGNSVAPNNSEIAGIIRRSQTW